MKKFLYITDREEYTEHNFIGALFEKYLPELMDVDVVYFSKYKSFFEDKGNGRFVAPIHEKNNILQYLGENNINVHKYDYIVVRNIYDILENILKSKDKYNIKVGYRLSFPKVSFTLENAKAENKSTILMKIDEKMKLYTRAKLINKCDIFLPTSHTLKDIYCPDINIKTHIVRSGIDPDNIHSKVRRKDNKIFFVYAGTLSKLRNFETVLEAFSELKTDNWKLFLLTKNNKEANDYITKLKLSSDNIEVKKTKTKDELLDIVAHCDIGLALLPDIDIFNTSTQLKTIDYYTTSIPTLMTNSEKNRKLFTDNTDAWLSDFNKNSIANKLNEILKTPKDKIRTMGLAGQAKLLEKRDYRKIARDLAEAMQKL